MTSSSSPASSSVSPPLHRLVGVVALEGAEPLPGDEGHDVGEDRRLDLRAVDGGAGRLGDRRDGADVVEVAVGEEDRLDRHAHLLDRGQDPLGLLAGVDDQRPVGAVAAQQEAVLGDRADREHLDIEAHFLCPVADPRPLAPPPHRRVDVVAGRDVEDEHEGAEGERDADRRAEEQQQQDGEDGRGDHAAGDRAAPGRRAVDLRGRRLRLARARAFASSRLRGRAARRLVSMRPPWVPRCLRRRFFFV